MNSPVAMRTRNDMHAVQFANTLGCRRTGIYRCLNCANIATDHNRHQAAADLLLADQVLRLQP